MDFVELARQAWDAGDFDKARMFYQKASYGIHDTDQANKDAFAQEVAGFAGQDPLYQKGLALIRDHIRQQGKPVLQSEMTAYVKKHWGDAQTEQLRDAARILPVADLTRALAAQAALLAP